MGVTGAGVSETAVTADAPPPLPPPRLRRVMLVDDDADILTLFHILLKRAFEYSKVDAFMSSKRALEQLWLHRSDYQLLVSDVRMPEVSGFVLAREAKTLNSSIIVVLVSAFEISPEEVAGATLPSLAVDGFIKKPISMTAFIETMKRVVRSRLDTNGPRMDGASEPL
jgi:DNA-binding NtrC family response regulator